MLTLKATTFYYRERFMFHAIDIDATPGLPMPPRSLFLTGYRSHSTQTAGDDRGCDDEMTFAPLSGAIFAAFGPPFEGLYFRQRRPRFFIDFALFDIFCRYQHLLTEFIFIDESSSRSFAASSLPCAAYTFAATILHHRYLRTTRLHQGAATISPQRRLLEQRELIGLALMMLPVAHLRRSHS
jgi:hypothetical protein